MLEFLYMYYRVKKRTDSHFFKQKVDDCFFFQFCGDRKKLSEIKIIKHYISTWIKILLYTTQKILLMSFTLWHNLIDVAPKFVLHN
jgi:hypothetical protein